MQLLIVDIQNTYRAYCSSLIEKIPSLAENYSHIIYLFDNISGQEFYEEVPEEWMSEELESFYDSLNVVTKQYAFFRGLMDVGVDEDDEELVKLARFMIKHNINDAQDIAENEEALAAYQVEFKNSPLNNISFSNYRFSIPDDLIEEIASKIRPGVVLVGGGRNQCLKEVSLLLRVLDIEHSILEEYTY